MRTVIINVYISGIVNRLRLIFLRSGGYYIGRENDVNLVLYFGQLCVGVKNSMTCVNSI